MAELSRTSPRRRSRRQERAHDCASPPTHHGPAPLGRPPVDLMRDMSGRPADATTGTRSTPRVPVGRVVSAGASDARREPRPDHRLLEEEFIGHEETGHEREELDWGGAFPEPEGRRRGRAHVISALVTGVVVFVALTVHALDAGRSPSGVVAGTAPSLHATPGVPPAEPRANAGPTRGGLSRARRAGRATRSHGRAGLTGRAATFATRSQGSGRLASSPSPSPSPSPGRPLSPHEFGFER
jgi:hypothetical protein